MCVVLHVSQAHPLDYDLNHQKAYIGLYFFVILPFVVLEGVGQHRSQYPNLSKLGVVFWLHLSDILAVAILLLFDWRFGQVCRAVRSGNSMLEALRGELLNESLGLHHLGLAGFSSDSDQEFTA